MFTASDIMLMLTSLKKMFSKGHLPLIFPETFQKLAVYQSINGVNPRNIIYDSRNEEQVKEDE